MIIKSLQTITSLAIPIFFCASIWYWVYKKINVYDSFVTGAKSGLEVIIKIFPYLLGIFIAIKTFQSSVAFDVLKNGLGPICAMGGFHPDILSIALIKPLSGSASTGVFT